MSSTETDGASGLKNKEDGSGNGKESYEGLHNSTQTFGSIGLLEAVCGDVVLRGRHGERDHLYDLDKAIKRYDETSQMVAAMARHAIRGWDTLMDICKSMEAVICEAIRQRESLGRPVDERHRDFLEKHRKATVSFAR